MAAQSLCASAQFNPSENTRRHLDGNVVCMHAEDRPPVAQTRGSRGRYPAGVTPLRHWRRNPFPAGSICELRVGGHVTPVLVCGQTKNFSHAVLALGGKTMIVEGEAVQQAAVPGDFLYRSAVLEITYGPLVKRLRDAAQRKRYV